MLPKIRLLAPAPAISKRHPFLTGLAKRRKSEGGIMPAKPVLALLTISTALAVLILGGLWYVFFRI